MGMGVKVNASKGVSVGVGISVGVVVAVGVIVAVGGGTYTQECPVRLYEFKFADPVAQIDCPSGILWNVIPEPELDL